MKKSYSKWTKTDWFAIGLLIVGILGTIFLPYLLTHLNSCLSFNLVNAYEIGDAISGTTAPLIGLINAGLIYLALREQINSRKEDINEQIEKQYFDLTIDEINTLINYAEEFSRPNMLYQNSTMGFNQFMELYLLKEN